MNPRTQVVRWLALGLAALSGCSTRSTSFTDIVVQVTNAPGTLAVNQSVSLTATVANDKANAGVDWTCSPSGACGSFNPTHTADGGTTVYTAPSTPGTVTITATSTAKKSAAGSASVIVVAGDSNALLNGPYVFLVQGIDTSGGYFAAGTILADGRGNITGGEQDYADALIQTGPDAVTGTYTIGPDGRGSITLKVANPSAANNAVETFSIAMVSARRALIIQFDGTATSSGTLDRQASGAADDAAVSGPFAFVTSGYDIGNGTPLTWGGVAGLDAGSGAVKDGQVFANDGGSYFSSSLTGGMTAPDAFGRGRIAFDVGINFVYYAVRSDFLRLIEPDIPVSVSAGTACGQGPAGRSSSFSNASLNGNFAFYLSGTSVIGPLGLAGQFTADGQGNFTLGHADLNDGGTLASVSMAGSSLTKLGGDGTGTLSLPGLVSASQNVSKLLLFAVDPAINLLDPGAAGGGGGALLMDVDSTAVGAGLIVPQSSGPFQGDYAVNLQAVGGASEMDIVGRASANAAGNLTGTVDINDTGLTTAGAALSGTLAADTVNPGRWTGTIKAGPASFAVVYYQVNRASYLFLDMNPTDAGNGFLQGE